MPDIREIGEDELGSFVGVRNAVWPHDPFTVEDYLDWGRQAEDAVWLLAVEGGSPVGAGLGIHGWHSPAGVGRMEIHVVEDARGKGTGTVLLDRLGAWLAAHGCGEATATVFEPDAQSLAWAGRRGFVEVSRHSGLALDLTAVESPDPAPPAGIEIVPWAARPDLARGMHAVYVEASPDIPGDEEVEMSAFEDWLANDMQGSGDRPEATFVALAGDEVVGYAKLSISGGQHEVAWHDLTGVKRAWRGRGIAGALKRTQIAWAKANGFELLRTANEERNEPIRRLNQRHGYRPEPGSVTVRGPIGDEGGRP